MFSQTEDEQIDGRQNTFEQAKGVRCSDAVAVLEGCIYMHSAVTYRIRFPFHRGTLALLPTHRRRRGEQRSAPTRRFTDSRDFRRQRKSSRAFDFQLIVQRQIMSKLMDSNYYFWMAQISNGEVKPQYIITPIRLSSHTHALWRFLFIWPETYCHGLGRFRIKVSTITSINGCFDKIVRKINFN